jgi:hypothetical protein
MSPNDPLLQIRFDGKSVGPGRIPVAHLLRFLANLNKALLRTGMVLTGEANSLRPGAHEQSNKQAVALDLVLLTHGSPAAVLGFERTARTGDDIFGEDLGDRILETAFDCLQAVQQDGDTPPVGCDPGVLMAWRDAGVLFSKDISSIEFSLNHREVAKVVTFTPNGFANIQRRIRGPVKNIRTIEGRLLMADFKEHGTRCRIHPSASDPVLCLFDLDRKDEVLENILQYVRIVGEAKEDPDTGRIASIRIHDIERLEEKQDMGLDLLPQGSPIPRDFWQSPSLDELATAQAVRPVADISELLGGWPGDADDSFEEEIHHIRQAGLIGGQS